MAGAVPSTLHQKVKFVVEESLIIVVAEEDIITTTIVIAPYLKIKKDATECSFRSFEVAIATNIKGKPKTLMFHLSQNTQMVLWQIVGKGAKTRHGLGRNLQGTQMVISSAPKRNRYGIGYQLGDQRRNGWIEIQKKNRRVKSNLVFLSLNWTFKLGGYINDSQFGEDEDVVTPFRALTINIITKDEEIVKIARPAMYPCSPDFELNN